MKTIPSEEKSINLLWTGGWDSTFQLLRLLLVHKVPVSPFYLIDAERPSTGVEIRTMQRIKDRLSKEFPHTKELLQPTQYFAVADISPDTEITEAFLACSKERHLGIQFEWLARFCKENGIADIQLCAQADRHPDEGFFDNNICQIISEEDNGTQTALRIDPKFETTSEYIVFRYFSFPVLRISKVEMSAIGKQEGWEDVMNMTWFCHNPTKKVKPCGKCNPCFETIKEGLGWRIPLKSRLVHLLYKTLVRPLKSQIKIRSRRIEQKA